jgi:hypothetical protein
MKCKLVSDPLTAPHFVRRDKVIIITKNIFLRGQPNRKLRDRQLGVFIIKQRIEKDSYGLKLPARVRLHSMLYVNNPQPCSTSSLRHVVHVTTPNGDDDDVEVSHIFALCIKLLHGRRGKYMLFMTHFNDNDIPRMWHQLNDVHRATTSQNFLETPQ